MSTPKLSIIVTSYNIEAYIEECLTSIVEQTFANTEIIVVDDGSSDRSPEIISSIAASDDRVVPILLDANSLGGVATAANVGLDRATGEYVGFADGDDVYDRDMFRKLFEVADRHDADLAMCDYLVLDEQSKELSPPADAGRWAELGNELYVLDSAESRKRFLRFIAVPWRKLYRRSMLEENGVRFPVGDFFFEDNPFHWASLLSAASIAVVPEPLCHHRVARVGQTMASADERLLRIFAHHGTIHELLVERGVTDEYGPTLLAWAISQMEWIAPRTPASLLPDLFDNMQTILSCYSSATINQALAEGRKGKRSHQLVSALQARDLAQFEALLKHPVTTEPNVFSKAMFHLRRSGVRATLATSQRYLIDKARLRGFATRRPHTSVSNEDVMLGLMVLSQKLEQVEDAVSRLTDDLDRG